MFIHAKLYYQVSCSFYKKKHFQRSSFGHLQLRLVIWSVTTHNQMQVACHLQWRLYLQQTAQIKHQWLSGQCNKTGQLLDSWLENVIKMKWYKNEKTYLAHIVWSGGCCGNIMRANLKLRLIQSRLVAAKLLSRAGKVQTWLALIN